MNCDKPVIIFLVLVIFTPCVLSQQASVSPSALSFEPQVINLVSAGSPSQTLTVTNRGASDLVISSITASGGYRQSNNCSTVLPGESCTVNVTFEPGTLGSLNGAITVIDNAQSSPQIVSLSGKGTAPAQLSPHKLSFGTIAVGSGSQPTVLRLTANSDLSINQISVSGNFTQANNCPSSLRAGQSCTIDIVFSPTVNASVTGAVSVSTAVGTTALAFSAALTGAGSGNVVSHVSIQPAILTFANKGPDLVDSVKELTVTNTSSNTTLTIQSISLSGSPNAVGAFPIYSINSNSCVGMLAPGAKCKIGIALSTTFSRAFPLNYPGALTITDNDPTLTQVVGLSGKQVAQLTPSPASLVFPSQPVGSTATKTLTLTGNDVQNGLLLDITASGDFSESGDLSPCFLAQRATCSMTISFTPKQTGVIKGSITLETYPECNPFPLHECSDPVVLSLSGTGK